MLYAVLSSIMRNFCPLFLGRSVIARAHRVSTRQHFLSYNLKISEINHALSPNTCTIKDEISFLSIQHFSFILRASAEVEGAEQLNKDLIFFFRRALKPADRRVCATWYSSQYAAAASSSPVPAFRSLSRMCYSFGRHSRNSKTSAVRAMTRLIAFREAKVLIHKQAYIFISITSYAQKRLKLLKQNKVSLRSSQNVRIRLSNVDHLGDKNYLKIKDNWHN